MSDYHLPRFDPEEGCSAILLGIAFVAFTLSGIVILSLFIWESMQ